MDNRSPRSREILGPRPTPLKIRKDSHKIIKKPPLAPSQPPLAPSQPPPLPQLQRQETSQPPRGPVIIYTVSPKIIHTHPNNFMSLVQRLTGKTSTSTTSSSFPSTSAPNDTSAAFDASLRGSVSPAARYAATEKANTSSELGLVGCVETTQQYTRPPHQTSVMERHNFYPSGILSPGPTSLPLISPEFFSTAGQTDPPGLSSFFNDFNSILQTSPSTIRSPPPSTDLFNNFFDS